MGRHIAVVTPVLDDWESFATLVAEISSRFTGADVSFDVVALDDGSRGASLPATLLGVIDRAGVNDSGRSTPAELLVLGTDRQVFGLKLTVVQISSLTSGWYAASYVGARRIL